MSESDFVLVSAAIECSKTEAAAARILREECGWRVLESLRRVREVLMFRERIGVASFGGPR